MGKKKDHKRRATMLQVYVTRKYDVNGSPILCGWIIVREILNFTWSVLIKSFVVSKILSGSSVFL